MIEILRKIGRTLGLNPIIYKILFGSTYEKKFDKALIKDVKSNDVFFDIGANRGHYIKNYLDLGCKIYAFEPDKSNFKYLCKSFGNNKNVTLINAALGNKSCKIGFNSINENEGVNSSVNEKSDELVEMYSLDDFCDKYEIIPNVIKIDVEGYEIEVLNGSKKTLSNKSLFKIGIEIHNSILNKNGYKSPNKFVASFLRNYGFKVQFPDFSHAIGFKK